MKIGDEIFLTTIKLFVKSANTLLFFQLQRQFNILPRCFTSLPPPLFNLALILKVSKFNFKKIFSNTHKLEEGAHG